LKKKLPKIFHDGVSLFLGHVAMHGAYSEIRLSHPFSEPVNLPFCVAENDRLKKTDW